MNNTTKDKIDALVKAGKFVVIGEVDRFSPETNEVLGRETVIISVQDTRWAAEHAARYHEWHEVYHNSTKILPIKNENYNCRH